MEPRVQFASAVDGTSIAMQVLGRGTPLIIVPSGPWSVAELEWRIPRCEAWYRRLAHSRQVVRYDMRGTGHSTRSEHSFGLQSRLLDLDAVVAFTQADRVALFAAQHAGPIAIQYAAMYPKRVSHLLLWCTYAKGRDYFSSTQSRALHGVQRHDWSLFTETVSHAHSGWEEGDLAHRLAALLRENTPLEMIQSFDSAAQEVDVTGELADVRASTTIFHRRSIPHPDIALSRDLAAAIPEARFVLLDGDSMVPFIGDTVATHTAINRAVGGEELPSPNEAANLSFGAALAEPMSERELEVLQLVAAGRSNREVAAMLFISVGTVKTHMVSVFGKLGVHSRTHAVARARELGLLLSSIHQ